MGVAVIVTFVPTRCTGLSAVSTSPVETSIHAHKIDNSSPIQQYFTADFFRMDFVTILMLLIKCKKRTKLTDWITSLNKHCGRTVHRHACIASSPSREVGFAAMVQWSITSRSICFNHLSPHDALKHHFASLKNYLISWKLVVLEHKLSWNCFKNNSIFYHLSPTSSHFHPLQVEHCNSNSRLVVDENDNGKLRLERVNLTYWITVGLVH